MGATVRPSSGGSRGRRPARRGLLLVDLAITLAIIAIVLIAVVPTVRPEEHVKLIAASAILASDIEFAQSSTLAAPGDPTIFRIDPQNLRYWLALESDPETPIPRPNSAEPYEVVFGQGDANDLWGLTITLTNVADGTIAFDAFGRLRQQDDPHIVLANEAGDIRVRVRAGTGSVWIENTGP